MTVCTPARSAARARGFTLIEVMVVLAVMGVVAMLAAPNVFGLAHRMNLSSAGRQLYAAFITAQGRATSTGTKYCLRLSRTGNNWSIREDSNNNDVCDATDRLISQYPSAGDQLSSGIGLGPLTGSSVAFAAPYNNIAHNAWCTPAGLIVAVDTASIVFDIDGRIIDSSENPVDGTVMLYDSSTYTSRKVAAVVFTGATGNIRLFDSQE